jgi:hypothetical protein
MQIVGKRAEFGGSLSQQIAVRNLPNSFVQISRRNFLFERLIVHICQYYQNDDETFRGEICG